MLKLINRYKYLRRPLRIIIFFIPAVVIGLPMKIMYDFLFDKFPAYERFLGKMRDSEKLPKW